MTFWGAWEIQNHNRKSHDSEARFKRISEKKNAFQQQPRDGEPAASPAAVTEPSKPALTGKWNGKADDVQGILANLVDGDRKIVQETIRRIRFNRPTEPNERIARQLESHLSQSKADRDEVLRTLVAWGDARTPVAIAMDLQRLPIQPGAESHFVREVFGKWLTEANEDDFIAKAANSVEALQSAADSLTGKRRDRFIERANQASPSFAKLNFKPWDGDPKDIDRIIASLEYDNRKYLKVTADTLQKTKPNGNCERVARALENQLVDRADVFDLASVLGALSVWGDQQTPVAILKRADFNAEPWRGARFFARKTLATLFADFVDDDNAVEVIRHYSKAPDLIDPVIDRVGVKAGPAVIELLRDPVEKTREGAILWISKNGDVTYVKALGESAKTDPAPRLRTLATQAAKLCRARIKKS